MPTTTTVLTISAGELRRLCGFDATDTSQDAALATLQAAEQLTLEYALDPTNLAIAVAGLPTASPPVPQDLGLLATLTLGVAECLAGSYLQQVARSPGMMDDITVGPIHVTSSKTASLQAQAQRLSALGAARLAPWGRAPRVPGAMTKGAKVPAAPADLLASAPPLVPGGLMAAGDGASVFDYTPSEFWERDDPWDGGRP